MSSGVRPNSAMVPGDMRSMLYGELTSMYCSVVLAGDKTSVILCGEVTMPEYGGGLVAGAKSNGD